MALKLRQVSNAGLKKRTPTPPIIWKNDAVTNEHVSGSYTYQAKWEWLKVHQALHSLQITPRFAEKVTLGHVNAKKNNKEIAAMEIQ